MLPSKNYFKIFNLEKSFNVNLDNLKSEYYQLNKKYHPDILKTESSPIQEINTAYKTLKDDYLRAKYLKSAPIKEKMDQKFLLEILDLEEQIDDANVDELKNLKKVVSDKINLCKANYKNDTYLGKWGYYRRLDQMIGKKLNKMLALV